MARMVVWENKKKAKEILGRRLKAAMEHRKRTVESEWIACKRAVFDTVDGNEEASLAADNLLDQQETSGADTEDFDLGERIDVKYAYRNLRLIHSHMSSNPPVATARSMSPDEQDRRASNAAQMVMHWFRETQDLHEKNDLTNLDVLTCGTGVTFTHYNPHAGRVIGFDDATGEIELEGEIEIRTVKLTNFWVDPNAEPGQMPNYSFEACDYTEDEIRSYWPDKYRIIKKLAKKEDSGNGQAETLSGNLISDETEKECMYRLFHYYEPGLPENGMLGRFVICTKDGTPIEGPTINPNLRYPPPTLDERRKEVVETGVKTDKGSPIAYWPYQVLTDIDVPNRFWGRSALYYVIPAQNLMANIDSATLEAVKAHGVARMILPPGAKMAEGALSNSSIEVLQLEEDNLQGRIEFLAPPGLPNAMPELRQRMRDGIDDMWGINESMFGQQNREQSAVSMQYAVNQGAMVRRRLFNKSIRFVRQQYQALLSLAVQHWDTPKALSVLGQESAYDTVELLGIDVMGGYEIGVEYGTHLPLDPMTRRDEIMRYMPLLKEAGVSPMKLAANLKLADIQSTFAPIELAENRGKEIVDTIVATNMQVRPRRFQDHTGILAYLMNYVNTADAKRLDETAIALIEDHIQLRLDLAGQEKAPAGGAPAPGGGPMAELAPGPAPEATTGVEATPPPPAPEV